MPLHGLKPIYEALAVLQRRFHTRGDLELVGTVDSNGQVVQVQTLGEVDPALSRNAATVLSLTRFKPALCQGVPCRMDFPVRMRFTLAP